MQILRVCAICLTNEVKPVVAIGVAGVKSKQGNEMEAARDKY